MGTVCSLDKGQESDQHEKDSDESTRTRKTIGMLSLQQFIHRMATEILHRQPARGLRFQDDMRRRATPQDCRADEEIQRARKEDAAMFKRHSRKGADGKPHQHFVGDHFLRNADLIQKSHLLAIAQLIPKGAHLHIHFNSTLLPEVLLGCAKDVDNMYISSNRCLRTKEDFEHCALSFCIGEGAWMEDMSPVDPESKKFELLHKHDSETLNLFTENGIAITEKPTHRMRYQYFREMWNKERKSAKGHELCAMDMTCDDWLASKLVFSPEEIDLLFRKSNAGKGQTNAAVIDDYALREMKKGRQVAEQTCWPIDMEQQYEQSPYLDVRIRAAKAWDKFNSRTQMMKGLFNYERAFRVYTRKCLEEFIRDNVQYAEIRPNFMKTNQILMANGKKMDNEHTVEIIIEEYMRFMNDTGDMEGDKIKENRRLDADGNVIYNQQTGMPEWNRRHRPALNGLKIIYCTPRSFKKDQIKLSLQECIEFKQRWPEYIAGFDLVGEEAYPEIHPLRYFETEFKNFQKDCANAKVEIPFLFHCGETPEDLEGNLDCALELGSRRIGHGYALPKKPEIMRKMRENGVCVETCPISNMVLGLTEFMKDHAVYELLRENVHCAVSSDNGTIFKSTLSHDFYEIMAGNNEMNLYGWQQLARWSIDHSCLSQVERERLLTEWQLRWEECVEAIGNLRNKAERPEPDRLLKLENARKAARRREEAAPNTGGSF